MIAAEHAVASTSAATDWSRVCGWYADLEELTGSPVVRLNRAVAVAETDGALAGLRMLDGLDFPGYWLPATRAELQARAGHRDDAARFFDEATAACDNDAERTHLQ